METSLYMVPLVYRHFKFIFQKVLYFGLIWGSKIGVWHPAVRPYYYFRVQVVLKFPSKLYKPVYI